jgi:predicted RNA methylase
VMTVAPPRKRRRLIDGLNISGKDTLAALMRFRDPGYTPAFRELGTLLELVDEGDDDAVKAILRIDAQHRPKIAKAVADRARAAVRPARGRLTRLAGRLGAVEWLIAAVGDEDPKTRHTAARALSKIEATPEITRAVLAAWDAGNDEDKKALADAVARVGGEEAKKRLPKTGRASLVLERDEARASTEASAIDVHASADEPLTIRFHSREGLEGVVAMEVGESNVIAPGIVEATLRGPLSRALAVRTATHVSFPHHGEDIVEVVSKAAELRTFTKGRPIRFRVAGTTRAEAWKVAERTRAAADDLVNDPRASTWEVSAKNGVVELVPRGYEDQRFTYRTEMVAASSHPTIAAAIALVAPRKAIDIVWDPFVGAGAELVERARLGPYARLIGTDIDPDAVKAAQRNLANAGLRDTSVEEADALTYDFGDMRPTLILTNPPMGRRVQRGTHKDVLERFVDRAAAVLAPGGHLVWTVPEPKKIEARARRAGLSLQRAWTIDMGGFQADLAVYKMERR